MQQADHINVVRRAAQRLEPELRQLFEAQWQDPEISGLEHRASDRLAAFLAAHGFAVEQAASGIPTAFIATFGNENRNGPVVAILAEYDALPGLANAASPVRQHTGQNAGHACGHNHIGPANAAAAIIAAQHLAASGQPGVIKVIGCPAEEILWGKIALLKQGAFACVDAILTSHGDYQNGALSRPCQSVVSGEFVFLGAAGHGGFAGTANALLAAEAFITRALAQATSQYPDVSLRHVIRQGGIMPGVTPEVARVWFTARHVNMAQARNAYEHLLSNATATAAERQIGMRHQFISETRGYLPNHVMGQTLRDALANIGPPQWTDDDITFMQALVAKVAPGESMKLHRRLDYFDEGADYYGQDDGEVSWRIPLGRLNWAYPEQVPIHHWAWTALSGNPASHAGPLMAVKALALAAMQLFGDPTLIERAKAELRSRTADSPPDSPRLGAWQTMTSRPESFWTGEWTETQIIT